MPSRGRPRHFRAERTPSGRTRRGTGGAEDRYLGQELRLATLLERAKHTGLSLAQAADRRASSVEGAMFLHGIFSKEQAIAVERYRTYRNRYLETLPGPHLARAGMRGRAVDPENPAHTARIRGSYDTAQAVLKSAGKAAFAVISGIVERDRPPSAEEVPAARRGADALVAHFSSDVRVSRREERAWCEAYAEGVYRRALARERPARDDMDDVLSLSRTFDRGPRLRLPRQT